MMSVSVLQNMRIHSFLIPFKSISVLKSVKYFSSDVLPTVHLDTFLSAYDSIIHALIFFRHSISVQHPTSGILSLFTSNSVSPSPPEILYSSAH